MTQASIHVVTSSSAAAYISRATATPELFRLELEKLLISPQGLAFAIIIRDIMVSQRSCFAVELNKLIVSFLRREHALAQLTNRNSDK